MQTYRIEVQKPCDSNSAYYVKWTVRNFMQQTYHTIFPVSVNKKERRLEVSIPDGYDDNFSGAFLSYFSAQQRARKKRLTVSISQL